MVLHGFNWFLFLMSAMCDKKKNPANPYFSTVRGIFWRRRGDSNSCAGYPTYALSRGALFVDI